MKKIDVTIKQAIKNNLIKVGDEVYIKARVYEIDANDNTCMPVRLMFTDENFWFKDVDILGMHIEFSEIDFSVPSRVLQYIDESGKSTVVCTTGLVQDKLFSAYVIKSDEWITGYAASDWTTELIWTDVTEIWER
jgi:hypothetical protein